MLPSRTNPAISKRILPVACLLLTAVNNTSASLYHIDVQWSAFNLIVRGQHDVPSKVAQHMDAPVSLHTKSIQYNPVSRAREKMC